MVSFQRGELLGLARQAPLQVGDLPVRSLGLPQPEQEIRALEARQWPLIGCRINPHDKRKIDVEREAADDLGQEDPRPEIFVNEARILPNPSETGMLRVDALLDWTGIDVGACLEGRRRQTRQP